MFSGIIKSTGIVCSIQATGSTKRITIASPLADELTIDQSIAHDGICLTVVAINNVDTTIKCLLIQDMAGSWKIKFNLPQEYAGLIIPHGSICLNGISLTVANLYPDSFDVAIIPYTFEHTNFKHLLEGDEVNVEFDLIGKYLLRQAALRNS